jgi:glutamate racemase
MRSQEYLHAIKELDPMVGVYQKACPELVDIVESGQADSMRAEEVLHRDLADIVQLGADTLVLGCTHYPILRGTIESVVGDKVQIVDSAETTAVFVRQNLREFAAVNGEPLHHFLVTDAEERFRRIAGEFLERDIESLELVSF